MSNARVGQIGKLLASLAIIIALVVVSVLVIQNRQWLQDWYQVSQYQPSAQINDIVTKTTMTERSKFIFFATHPEINTADSFNRNCERKEQSSMILGCYAGDRIYIYQVEDARLSDVEDVTGAHEMLHAAWQRLDQGEKNRIGALLEAAYARVRTEKLDQRMQYYEKAEPGERINELHSILGTEFPDLGNDLEAYYSQYFSSRSSIVSLHDSYESLFDELDKKSNELKARIEQEVAQLNKEIESYNAQMTALNNDLRAHNAAASSIDRTNKNQVDQYNQAGRQLDTRRSALEAVKQNLDTRISQYNADIQSYNQTVLQSQRLNSSLDSMAQ